MADTVRMRCLIGSIGLQDFSIYSKGEEFEVEEISAVEFEKYGLAERIEEVKEPKKRGKNLS